MGYRFLKIQATGDSYIGSFLRQHPEHKSLSYDELYDLFLKSCMGWNTYYSRALASIGYDAMDICIDFEFLQKLWAREHNIKYDDRNWLKEIVSAQLKAFQPDIVFIDDLYYFDAPYRQFLRDASSKPIRIVGWRAAPTGEHEVFSDVDLMLTCTPLFVDQLRRNGANAELIMHAFEPSILTLIDQNGRRDLDFTFVGTFFLRQGFHNDRLELVKSLLATTKLEVWGTISEPQTLSLSTRIRGKLTREAQKVFDRLGASGTPLARLGASNQPYQGPQAASLLQQYRNRFHEPVLALEYFKILARSKLNLNKHIDCAENYAGNIRLFEATGMGACLVTDWKVNLPEMFVPDEEVIAYESPEECAEKVRYLLEHEDQMRSIAEAGQRRTLRDHTYQKRAEELDVLFRRLLAGAPRASGVYVECS
jgi:glycosyltransferase involved in cell wall biosynthesis